MTERLPNRFSNCKEMGGQESGARGQGPGFRGTGKKSTIDNYELIILN